MQFTTKSIQDKIFQKWIQNAGLKRLTYQYSNISMELMNLEMKEYSKQNGLTTKEQQYKKDLEGKNKEILEKILILEREEKFKKCYLIIENYDISEVQQNQKINQTPQLQCNRSLSSPSSSTKSIRNPFKIIKYENQKIKRKI